MASVGHASGIYPGVGMAQVALTKGCESEGTALIALGSGVAED